MFTGKTQGDGGNESTLCLLALKGILLPWIWLSQFALQMFSCQESEQARSFQLCLSACLASMAFFLFGVVFCCGLGFFEVFVKNKVII